MNAKKSAVTVHMGKKLQFWPLAKLGISLVVRRSSEV